MAGLWQRTGNVTVTNGSRTVTGFGTKWKTGTLPIQKGHAFYGPDGAANEVDTVVSDTEILLVEAYRGGTLANQPYKIDITRTSTISQFSAELSALVGKYRAWFDSMMTWLTGSGDVGILNPDTGATVTIPSWKKVASEGEGQAARAKVEADRARDEANRARDEADRTAGMVAAAALPLPDVWAPLTDSLRMFVGNGREVKVGDDVVARYVNFSRSTTATYSDKNDDVKAAAINEPRFERNGLLIDGQSTNLWAVQSGAPLNIINTTQESVTLPTGAPGNAYKVTPTSADFSYVRLSLLQQTGQHTLSCFARRADGAAGMPTLYTGHSGQLSIKASGVYVGKGWWRMYANLTSPTGNTGFGFGPSASDVIPVHICFFQLEALPYASSYIPTNGSAVARSADLATLPQSLNLGESQLGFSLAVEFDSVNTGAGRLLELSDLSTILTDGASVIIRHDGKEVYVANAPLGQRHHLAYSVAADGAITAALNGKLLALQTRSAGSNSSKSVISLGNLSNGSGGRPLYGHLRDLRIWTKKPLTADQLKVASA